MTNQEIPAEDLAHIEAIFYAGEVDFRDRALALLRSIEHGERSLIKGCTSIEEARRKRERADAIKGAAAMVSELPFTGLDSMPPMTNNIRAVPVIGTAEAGVWAPTERTPAPQPATPQAEPSIPPDRSAPP